jgi:hypothetical protein
VNRCGPSWHLQDISFYPRTTAAVRYHPHKYILFDFVLGIGRGDAFARHIPLGTVDWTDLDSMIDAAVKSGIADPDRLAIAGHSQGGFLALWGVTVSKRFKAA